MLAATAAFLSMIAFAEGTGDRYDITYDYHIIRDFDRHPNVVIRGGRYYSSAAGRYQFLASTYKEMQEKCDDVIDFTPPSQDAAAICMLDLKGVNHHEEIKTPATFKEEVSKVAKVWASLPGAGYGQPERKLERLWRIYREGLATERGKRE